MKVQKVEGRAEYLRHVLSKSVAAEVLDKPHLTYGDVVNANSMLYEYWQLTRKADVDRALGQPAGQAAAQHSKDANEFRRFETGENWSEADHRELVANMQRIKREFPSLVSNRRNSDKIAQWLLDNKWYPTYPNMRLAVTTLACEGKLLLNPSAVGIPEERYGDSIEGPYQISRVSAADLRLMTEPFRPQNERDEIRAMTADQFYASEHGRALREERNRHSDNFIREKELRQAEAAVEFFLASNRDYARTNDNRDRILRWLKDRNLPMTQNSLQQAFDELKHQLALTGENNAKYGATRVIDMADLSNTVRLPTTPQPVEIVDTKPKRWTVAQIRAMDAQTYAKNMQNPEFAKAVESLFE